MIERHHDIDLTPGSTRLDILQERARFHRHRYKQFHHSFGSLRNAVLPAFTSPVRTLRRVPARYLIHAVVAAALPVAFGLSQLPSRRDAAPVSANTAVADTPVRLGPLDERHFYDPTQVGDPPLQPSDAIPAPISLTSRSEAVAPVAVIAHVVPADAAKLRGGPGLAYDEVGHVPGSTSIEVIGRYGEWFQVRQAHEAAATWLPAELVDIPEAAIYTLFEVAESDIPPPPPPKVGTVQTMQLSLRDGPGTNYVPIVALDSGVELALVEQYQDWLHVATDYVDGWVQVDHLDIVDGVLHRVPVAEQIPDPNPLMVGVVTANGVNLRNGPGTAYATLGVVTAGTAVDVLAYHGEWYRVMAEDGTSAWLFGDLVDVAPMVQRRVAYTDNIPALPTPQPLAMINENEQVVSDASIKEAATPGEYTAMESGVAYSANAAEVSSLGYIPASGDVAGLALQFVGSAYVYGGASPGAFDCSGLVTYTYAQYGVYLPHNAAAQWYSGQGVPVPSINHLVPGDLVFFAGTSGPGITHVGIYVGGGRFVHAMMPGLGVQVSNLWEPYWLSHYYGAMRVYR